METPAESSERKQEDREEREVERDAGSRREDQAELVVRPLVVDAVNEEVHALGKGPFALVVEYGSMEPILGERPERETAHEQPGAR